MQNFLKIILNYIHSRCILLFSHAVMAKTEHEEVGSSNKAPVGLGSLGSGCLRVAASEFRAKKRANDMKNKVRCSYIRRKT